MAGEKFLFVDSVGRKTLAAAAVQTSAGAGDAGKLAQLDSGGQWDASMIDDADIDHGLLGGLADDDHTQYTLADGTRAFSGNQSMGSNKLTSVANGIADADAVNLGQLNAAFNNLDRKDSVRFATTAALPSFTGTGTGTLTLTGQTTFTPDGTAVSNGDRILVKDEGASDLDHGMYVVSGVGVLVVLTRTEDANTDAEVTSGLMTTVEEGAIHAGSLWLLTTADPITLNTTPLAFTQLSVNALTASLGVEIVSNDIRLDLLASGGLKITGNEVGVEPADFAGTGLIDDGSDNLKIDFSTTFSDEKAVAAQDLNSSTNGEGASIIGIEDTAGNFIATDVEAALAELADDQNTEGVDYTVGTGGITKGDLCFVSANNEVKPLVISADTFGIGLALTTEIATATVRVSEDDQVIAGILSAATAGDRQYWNGSAWVSIIPTGSSSYIWRGGVAKNATDMHVDVEFQHRNAA